MPDGTSRPYTRRVEVTLGLLLAATSFAPWWTRDISGSSVSAWTGPHLSWLPVMLCLAMVAGRSLRPRAFSNRWAMAGTAVALAIADWGWLTEFAQRGPALNDGQHQLAWVLQQQGPTAAPAGAQFAAAWGFSVGMCLMLLLLATFAASAIPKEA